jgi:hypothetical protein
LLKCHGCSSLLWLASQGTTSSPMMRL